MGHNNSNLAEKKTKIAAVGNEPSEEKKAVSHRSSGAKKMANGKNTAPGQAKAQEKKDAASSGSSSVPEEEAE